MSEEQYYIHRDGSGRFLLQSAETGGIVGLIFPGMPGESARAFSYDYGSVSYPHQLLNHTDFPELAEMPFFTIEGCYWSQLEVCLKQNPIEVPWAVLSTWAKASNFSYKTTPSNLTSPNNIRWQYTVPNPKGSWVVPILDLWVNEQGCWTCNRDGQVLALNFSGEPIQAYTLPNTTRCFVTNLEDATAAPWVSCDDGFLYDLTGKVPQAIGSLTPEGVYRYTYPVSALDAFEGRLFRGDFYGGLGAFTHNLQPLWQHTHRNHWHNYFLQSDLNCLYQGHYHGLSAYCLNTGDLLWQQPLALPVMCGCLTLDEVIVACGDRMLYALSRLGNAQLSPALRALERLPEIPYALIASPDSSSMWVGDWSGQITQLDRDGQAQEVYHLDFGAITALGVAENNLYAGTGQGQIVCLGRK